MKDWWNRLVVQFWIPLVLSTFLVVGIIALYLPQRQGDALVKFNQEALQELTKSLALSVQIALERDDYTGVQRTIAYVAGSNTLTFSAIILMEEDSTFVLAKFPETTPDSVIFSNNQEFLLERQYFESDFLQGYVVLGSDNTYINEELFSINRSIYGFLFFIFLLGMTLNFALARRFSRPILTATGVAKELALQNYDVFVPIKTEVTELKELGLSLDSLRRSIKEKSEENEKLTATMQTEIERQTKQLSEALSDLEQNQLITDNVINTALDAVITANANGEVIRWNRAATSIFGFSEDEAMGKLLTDLIIPSEMKPLHNKGMAHYHATGHGPVLNQQIEVTAKTKEGKIIDIELFITPIKVGDTVIFSSFLRDISESKRLRKLAEEQRTLLDNILNALPMDIYLKNQEERFVFVNDSFITSSGIDREDAFLKKNQDLFVGEVLDTLEKEDAEAWQKGGRIIKERVRYHTSGHQYFLVGREVITIKHEDKNITKYLMSFALDITNTKDAENKLREALKAKDDFLSTMSHEIRTPLHSILGLSDVLLKQNLVDEHKEMLSSVTHSAQHLMGLISDILDFSKISSGKLELNPVAVDLRNLINHNFKQFERQASSKNISLTVAVPSTLKHHVIVDDIRLTQILNNLLSNALKFTLKGGIQLVLKELDRHDEKVALEFSVIDTGKGIHPDKVDLVQEAFIQENSSISREFGGTGLGLSIVNSLLRLMDSHLSIESILGKGSQFSFVLHLPLGRATDLEIKASEPSVQEKLSLHILYVEDTIPNQFLMRQMVKPWGVKLAVVSSANEALEISHQDRFDLILMDIQMPIIDGIQAFGMIRRDSLLNQETPIVAFTANAETGDINRYLEIGFQSVITKPIAPKKLFEFLKKFTDHGA